MQLVTQLASIMLLVSIAVASESPPYPVNMSIPVRSWTWITVANPDGIANGNGQFPFGDECGLDPRGTLTIMAQDHEHRLVRYHYPDKQFGSGCPDGTLIIYTVSALSRLTEEWTQNAEADQRQRHLLLRLLNTLR